MHNQIRPRDDGSYVVVNDDVIEIAMQGSTHWDALAHWGAIEPDVPGVYFGGAGLNETFPEFGAKTLGIDQLAAGVVTRGVLLDFVREIDGPEALFLADGHNIGLAQLESCLRRENVQLAAGDVVFTYTGFQQRVKTRGFGPAGRRRAAGARNCCSTRCRCGARPCVFALCSDNPSVEPVPMPDGRFHTIALKHLGIHLGELFALDDLVEACRSDGVYEFLLVSTPLNVRRRLRLPAERGGHSLAARARGTAGSGIEPGLRELEQRNASMADVLDLAGCQELLVVGRDRIDDALVEHEVVEIRQHLLALRLVWLQRQRVDLLRCTCRSCSRRCCRWRGRLTTT